MGWADGRTGGRADGRTDGHTDRHTDRHTEYRNIPVVLAARVFNPSWAYCVFCPFRYSAQCSAKWCNFSFRSTSSALYMCSSCRSYKSTLVNYCTNINRPEGGRSARAQQAQQVEICCKTGDMYPMYPMEVRCHWHSY